jgi:type II secretory ATPase GspE/PulE/Tfp pilus assembly ATPase PilB-like protein
MKTSSKENQRPEESEAREENDENETENQETAEPRDDAAAESNHADAELRDGDEELDPLYDLVKMAITKGATDIHLDPVADGMLVRIRLDGAIREIGTLSPELSKRILVQIRVETEMEFGRIFFPLEGQFTWSEAETAKDIRVTLLPVGIQEAAHLRILTPPEALTDVTKLGLRDEDMDALRRSLGRPQGLVVVAGPTGAGKTTTLYSLARTFDLSSLIAVSIEDPVEFDIPYIRQVEVDDRHELTMAEGLRVMLRMDPDLLVVSEIRDAASAVTSARAAAAAQFVLATIHSRDAAAAVEAFHFLSVPYAILGGALRAIVSQNLVRRLCPDCRKPIPLDDQGREWFERMGVTAPEKTYVPGGCDACDQYGFRGRIGIFEVAEIDEELGKYITEGPSQIDLRRTFRDRGVRPMLADGFEKVAGGVTSLEEILNLYWPGSPDGHGVDLDQWEEL